MNTEYKLQHMSKFELYLLIEVIKEWGKGPNNTTIYFTIWRGWIINSPLTSLSDLLPNQIFFNYIPFLKWHQAMAYLILVLL